MKKSLLLFIIWATAATLSTVLYLVAPVIVNLDMVFTFRGLVFIISIILSLTLLAFVHSNAKMEQSRWLAVVSKVLMIVYFLLYAARLVYFIFSVVC